MEKQTIGKFIAALRKASGMTQQDLADKLNVSNKSVSKWECDEGYPDLSLIAVIAEVFGVTSDEILKGARIVRSTAAGEPKENTLLPAGQPQKSEKQFNYLIQKKLSRFKYLSLIPTGLIIAGFALVLSFPDWPGCIATAAICFAAIFGLQYFFMGSSKTALYNPDFAEEKDIRILRAVKTIETYSFHVFAVNTALLINGIAFILLDKSGWLAFFLSSAPAVYLAALVIKALTSDRKYCDIAEQPRIKDNLRKLNIACVAWGAVSLAAVTALHFVVRALSGPESVASLIPDTLFYIMYSAAVSVTALTYILKRNTLLQPYSLITQKNR